MPKNPRTKKPLEFFQDISSVPREVVVLIYDFENFTSFLSIPDIHRDVHRYCSYVDREVRMIFDGGEALWRSNEEIKESIVANSLRLDLIHDKFLGDGAMFIAAVDPTNDPDDLDSTLKALCNRAFNLTHRFDRINRHCLEFMPVADLPKGLRIGITYGTVLELTRFDGQTEYVGYPINLAARLQKYSGSASFLASARLPRSHKYLGTDDYIKVRAKELRGRKDELVFIDKLDFERCQKSPAEKGLFEKISS